MADDLNDNLVEACYDGKFLEVCRCLDEGADPTAPHSRRYVSALPAAVFRGDVGIVKKLIAARASVDCTIPTFGATPLHIACKNAKPAMVRVLLEANADVNRYVELTGRTPLQLACRAGSVASARALIEKGACVADVRPNERHLTLAIRSLLEEHAPGKREVAL